MRRAVGRFLLSLSRDSRLHLGVRHPWLTAFVARIETGHSFLFKTPLPTGDRRRRGLQGFHDLAVSLTIGQRQDQTCPEHITGGQRPRLRPLAQLAPLFIRDR